MGRKGTFDFKSSNQALTMNRREKSTVLGRMVYAALEVTMPLKGEILCINWEAGDIMNAG